MLAGVYLFLRRHVVSSAAMFGALVFTFSSFNLLHFVHPNAVAVVAHIGWLSWSIDVLFDAPSRRQSSIALAAIALLTGSQLLLGYPQYVWFSLLVEAAYWLMARKGEWNWRVAARMARCRQTVWAAHRRRATLADDGRAGSFHSAQRDIRLRGLGIVASIESGATGRARYLFQTRVVGQNTHELGTYAGAVPLMLCVWLLANRQRWGRLKPLVLAAFTLGIGAIILACGEHTPLSSTKAAAADRQLSVSLPSVGPLSACDGDRFGNRPGIARAATARFGLPRQIERHC